jgi:proton-translocating NAD(P)+ transhydrogenase subunit beta
VQQNLINIAYLVSAVLFILGLKGLTSPRTARNGNLLGAAGMLVAVVATLLDRHILTFELILAGIVVGSAIGAFAALKVPITAMPQMVAAFNGFGGAGSALVAATAVLAPELVGDIPPLQLYGASAASAIIGAATFTGSMVAWAKLQEVLKLQPRGGFMRALNFLSIGGSVVLGAYYVYDPSAMWAFWGLLAAASAYGFLLTVPIGGADMPVVIALLNSLSGLAAAATGFVLSNSVLIISGTLVGASGVILTNIMCRAMNRSLAGVMSGNLGGPAAAGPKADDVYQGRVKSTTPEEAAVILEDARSVVIVPGYGMAVAQAQHAVRDMANLLQKRGVTVRYGIHPVAGRMPGHMNVLLAEADVPYDQLYEMERINPLFRETDVAIVIGANDVVNPAARDEPTSPIAGMPILEVDKAQTVIVIKRSLSPGFAGIPNKLFAADNTLMLYGDGREAVQELIAAMKE